MYKTKMELSSPAEAGQPRLTRINPRSGLAAELSPLSFYLLGSGRDVAGHFLTAIAENLEQWSPERSAHVPAVLGIG